MPKSTKETKLDSFSGFFLQGVQVSGKNTNIDNEDYSRIQEAFRSGDLSETMYKQVNKKHNPETWKRLSKQIIKKLDNDKKKQHEHEMKGMID